MAGERRESDGRATDDPATLENMALGLGCSWGHAVCKRLSWRWASLTIDEETAIGIVSPTRSLIVFPMGYVNKLLTIPESDQTSLLLYNMLKAGSFAEVRESYTIVE